MTTWSVRKIYESIKQKGRDAFAAGVKVEDCPYPPRETRTGRAYATAHQNAWMDGWQEAKDEEDGDV